jgi:hypothetical protein
MVSLPKAGTNHHLMYRQMVEELRDFGWTPSFRKLLGLRRILKRRLVV